MTVVTRDKTIKPYWKKYLQFDHTLLEDFEEFTIDNYKTTIFRNKYESNNPEQWIDKFIFTNKTEETLLQLFKIWGEDRINKITELLHLDHLNQEELDHVTQLITKHSNRFQILDKPLEPTNTAMHSIRTVDERPTFSKQCWFPPAHKEELTEQVNELLKNKIIKPSQSPYNIPVFIVPKKLDSHGQRKWRVVLDFRKWNEKTIGDSYLYQILLTFYIN